MSLVYKSIIRKCDPFVPKRLQPLWNHEAGPKTIFFWAPFLKWALVLTSLDQFRRPIEKISPASTGSLALTGFIWTRYSLIIKPIAYSLAVCNFSLGCANGVQCTRALMYQYSLPKAAEELEATEKLGATDAGEIIGDTGAVEAPEATSQA